MCGFSNLAKSLNWIDIQRDKCVAVCDYSSNYYTLFYLSVYKV